MRTVPAELAMLAMLLTLGLPAEEPPKELSQGQFEHALRNISTAPNYLVVVVANKNTGKRESVCMEAGVLLTALHHEHGLGWKKCVSFALAQPDRIFRFNDAKALKSVARTYTDQILLEARDFLANMTIAEIEAATRDQQSKFYEFCARKPGAFSGRFAAVAHVLSERGVLCVRSCEPGLFHVDQRKHNKRPPGNAGQ